MAQGKLKKIDTIGSVELISFTDFDIHSIPARVDTGAIFSSVWASDISVRKGVLRYKLFAPGNALYTGEVIKTTDFRTASVKSSFGHKEFRYKVRLSTEVGERKIKAWFTLANRAGMFYPVLVGRNILRDKFVVDVSKHKSHRKSASGQVLILASEAKDFNRYFKAVEKYSKQKVHYTLRDNKELAFYIKPGRVRVIDTREGKDIGDFDLAYFKSHKRDYPVVIAAAQYLSFRGVKVVDQEILSQISYDKLSEYMRLSLHNIPIPNTFCAPTPYLINHIEDIGNEIGWPMVCKEIEADKGRKNYLVDTPQQLKKILIKADKTDIYVLQQYIPNDGYTRALVLDRDVTLAIHRAPIKREGREKRHRYNVPYSDNVNLIKLSELDPHIHDLSVRAAVTMNRQVAGVDVLKDAETGEWFILEVNNAPQITKGPFIDERKKVIAKFFDEQLSQ